MTRFDPRLNRRALFATGSAAALLAAVGVSAQAAPTRGGHLRVALSGGDRTETWLDVPGGRFLQAARHAVFECLTEIAADGTLQPGLADTWTASANGQTWLFDLKQDVNFHDGTMLTSDDVAASLNVHEIIETVTALGRYQVEVTLFDPDPSLPVRLADGGFSIFAASDLAIGDLPMNGTGPYSIKRFDAGRGFLGARVENHRKDGTAGWFETVELIAISDEGVRADALREGFVDAADLSAGHGLDAHDDLELLSENNVVHAAIRTGVTHASRVGSHPLDAMRFATRWWMTT
ncbi:MAG: ABC transporter substrate-binding protein [Aliishimia sp.]